MQGMVPGQPLTQQIFIPNDMVGAIIGKGGAKINEIRQLSGSVIKINEPQDNSNERLVTITGTAECNQMALYMLYSRLGKIFPFPTFPTSLTTSQKARSTEFEKDTLRLILHLLRSYFLALGSWTEIIKAGGELGASVVRACLKLNISWKMTLKVVCTRE